MCFGNKSSEKKKEYLTYITVWSCSIISSKHHRMALMTHKLQEVGLNFVQKETMNFVLFQDNGTVSAFKKNWATSVSERLTDSALH